MVFEVIVDIGRVVEQLVEIGPGVEREGPGRRRVGIDLPGWVPVLERSTAVTARQRGPKTSPRHWYLLAKNCLLQLQNPIFCQGHLLYNSTQSIEGTKLR